MDPPPPPFLLTYTPPLAPLPVWLSYSSTPIRTATATYSYAVAGSPTLLGAAVVQTQYSVAVIQLAITVDAPAGIELGFPYVRAGEMTGVRMGSVLGGGFVTLAAPTSSPVPSPSRSTEPIATSISTVSISASVSGTPTTTGIMPGALSASFNPQSATITSAPSSTPPTFTSSSSTPSSTTASSSSRPPVQSTLAIVLGSIGAIILIILALWFFERRRRRRNRLAAADWRSSLGSSGQTERGGQNGFWRFAGLGARGSRAVEEKDGRRDMEEKSPFSDPTHFAGDEDIFTTPPRRFSRPVQHQSGRSVDETATLLDGWSSRERIAGDDSGGNRAPNDPRYQQRDQYEDAVGATGMLARLATAASSPYMNSVTNSPGSAVNGRESRVDLAGRRGTSMGSGIIEREEEGVEGDLSSPDSRYRTFASPVISEMGWMGGSKNRRRDEEYASIRLVEDGEGSEETFSTSGEGNGEGSPGSREGSDERRGDILGTRGSREELGPMQESPLPIFEASRWQGARTRQPVRGSPTTSDLNDYSTRLEPPILLSTPSPPSHSSSATLADDRPGVFGKLSAGFGKLTGLGLGTMSTSGGKETDGKDEESTLMNQGYQSPLGKNAAPLRLSPSRQKELLPPSPPRPTSSPRGRSSPDEMGREMVAREEEERKPLSLADRKARGMTNSSFGTLGQRVAKAVNSNSIYARSMASSSSAGHSRSGSESPIHFYGSHTPLRTHSSVLHSHSHSMSDPNSENQYLQYPSRSQHVGDSSGSSGSHRANTLGRGAGRREGESSSGTDPSRGGHGISGSGSSGMSHYHSLEASRSEGERGRRGGSD